MESLTPCQSMIGRQAPESGYCVVVHRDDFRSEQFRLALIDWIYVSVMTKFPPGQMKVDIQIR